MTYQMSWERKTDKWETLADTFDEMLNELNELDDTKEVFIAVDNFDEYEML